MTSSSEEIKSAAAAVNDLAQTCPAAWANSSVRMHLISCRDALLALAVAIDLRHENEQLKKDVNNYIRRMEHTTWQNRFWS